MPDDDAERETRRASLYARYVNLRCDMTQLLTHIAAVLQNSQTPPLTPEQVAEWVKEAEHYSELHETRSCALFSETVEFLSEPAASAQPQQCTRCGQPGTLWWRGGWLCEACNTPPA